jgi:mono/diheme cytochrome c family protein
VEAKLPGGEEFAAGKKAYAAQGCARCHKLGDTGGGPPGGGRMGKMGPPAEPPGGEAPPGPKGKAGGGMGGPDLTAVGAKPEHTADWLAAHVRDPKSHSPSSRMPAYGPDKIPEADLKALAEYLAGRT